MEETIKHQENVTLDPETCILVISVPRIHLNEILPENPLSSKSILPTKYHKWGNQCFQNEMLWDWIPHQQALNGREEKEGRVQQRRIL
jgi:hypothetical protein